MSHYKDCLQNVTICNKCFLWLSFKDQTCKGFKWWLSRINMFTIFCLVMLPGPAFTPNSVTTPFNQKQPGVFLLLLYIFTSIWNNPETNAWKWKHVVICFLKPFPSKVTQVSLNVSLVAFWALLMDHGVWFFDSWDCRRLFVNEGTNPGFNNQNAGFNNQGSTTKKNGFNHQQIQFVGCRIGTWP